ncbi:FAD/NAD(P)-binding domain-containing protein [Clavulina sp. PMI_390]|nr:FAD/NAD(P)-binding domain-containing protein [Clavulina sp. PMI_390]
MGGGVVAGDLFDTNSKLGSGAKSVLVIEKGGLPFHSHCLNAARPTGFGEDRAQQNDTFFALFKDEYKGTEGNEDWKGGPMFNLGGRSAAWGLFAPRVHDETLKMKFAAGSGLDEELIGTWYRKAEELMNLSLPATTTTHQNLMERLNMKTKRDCQWQWGRITSEFHDDKNFDFAAGAYSTIDKLVQIAMSKGRKPNGESIEHPNWKILLDTDVRKVTWSSDNKTATGVVVKGSDGAEYTIKLKARGTGPDANAALPAVVLAAGSVASPAILMRSGLTDFLTQNGGLHLTDHDIFSRAYTFRYLDPADRDRIGSMKLQSYLRPRPGSPIALANIAIDASSFLPRGPVGNDRVNQTFPLLTAAFIRPTELSKTNIIRLDDDGEPVVTVARDRRTGDDKADVAQLQDVTIKAIEVIKEALQIEILDEDKDCDDFFRYLELGGVAHELGTIPMPGTKKSPSCVDSDLKLRSKQGIYVCDLSVFPYSPEVNTSLTLVALALRLSRKIHSPIPEIRTLDDDTVSVVNQTGDKIRVFVSNEAGVAGDNQEEILAPGADMSRKRKHGVTEATFVYRLKYKSTTEFVNDPVLYIAKPGKSLLIQ